MDIQNVKTQLREWSEKLASLKDKADKVTSKEQGEFQRQLNLIDAKIETLRDKLTEAQHTNGQGNSGLQADVGKLLHELSDAFDSATAKIT